MVARVLLVFLLHCYVVAMTLLMVVLRDATIIHFVSTIIV